MELCRDTLWNSSVSWDTHTPRLSSCLQATIEVVAGSLLPLLLLPWLLLLSSTHHGLDLAPRGGRRGLFLVLLRCLTALLILGLTITIQLLHHPQLVVLEVVGTVLICTSALLSCTMEVAMVRARRHTSHLLAVHWLLLLLLLLPQLLGSVGELVQSAPLLPALLPLLRWVAVLLGVALQVPANTAVLPPGVQPQVPTILHLVSPSYIFIPVQFSQTHLQLRPGGGIFHLPAGLRLALPPGVEGMEEAPQTGGPARCG